MATNIQLLGKGWHYPFELDVDRGGVKDSEGLEHIKQSILQILGTAVGERVMQRTFGSRTADLLFEPNDPTVAVQLEHYLREAIENWEPRVLISHIEVTVPNVPSNRLDIHITYTVIQNNVTDNLVYPFYLSPEEQKRTAERTG